MTLKAEADHSSRSAFDSAKPPQPLGLRQVVAHAVFYALDDMRSSHALSVEGWLINRDNASYALDNMRSPHALPAEGWLTVRACF